MIDQSKSTVTFGMPLNSDGTGILPVTADQLEALNEYLHLRLIAQDYLDQDPRLRSLVNTLSRVAPDLLSNGKLIR